MKTELDLPHTHESTSDDYPLGDLPLRLWTIPRYPVLALIRLYQTLISPALPNNTCRFYPTCSHYGYRAIYKYGIFYGGVLAIWRVLRCNPFNEGGHDPVP